MKKTALFLGLIFLLPACASEEVALPEVSSGSYQKMSVHTPGVMGAICTLEAGGRAKSITTPGTVTVERSSDPMMITCTKGQYFRATQYVEPDVHTLYNGDEVLLTTYEYPKNITVAMQIDKKAITLMQEDGEDNATWWP